MLISDASPGAPGIGASLLTTVEMGPPATAEQTEPMMVSPNAILRMLLCLP